MTHKCPDCDGTGKRKTTPCKIAPLDEWIAAGGTREEWEWQISDERLPLPPSVTCDTCDGTGETNSYSEEDYETLEEDLTRAIKQLSAVEFARLMFEDLKVDGEARKVTIALLADKLKAEGYTAEDFQK